MSIIRVCEAGAARRQLVRLYARGIRVGLSKMASTWETSNTSIELTHVSKSYGREPALSDHTFEIPAGGRFALLGPNGAGKSTTLKLLVGSLRASR